MRNAGDKFNFDFGGGDVEEGEILGRSEFGRGMGLVRQCVVLGVVRKWCARSCGVAQAFFLDLQILGNASTNDTTYEQTKAGQYERLNRIGADIQAVCFRDVYMFCYRVSDHTCVLLLRLTPRDRMQGIFLSKGCIQLRLRSFLGISKIPGFHFKAIE